MTFPNNSASEKFKRLYEKLHHEWFEAELDELIQLYTDHCELLTQGYRSSRMYPKTKKGEYSLKLIGSFVRWRKL